MASGLLIIILLVFFLAIALFIFALLPLFLERYSKMQQQKVAAASKKLDNLFMDVASKKLSLLLMLGPVVLTLVGILIYHNVLAGLAGGVLGIVLPNVIIRQYENIRRRTFLSQLMDALLILSGCLKAGLSITQSFEVLVGDTTGPVSQEFSWVLKEIKIGVTLEESLRHLNRRMPSEELNLITNAILVSSATGGNLTKVFSRISNTIRENHKLKDKIKTLTLQGRLQGIIMAILPFIFVGWMLTVNKSKFDIMLNTSIGRTLLIVASVLLVIGIVLIQKFSKLPE